VGFKSVLTSLFFILFLFACKTQKGVYFNPNVICELKSPDGKIILTSQVKFSSDSKSEKNDLINNMYEKLLFNGLRQNQCVLNQLIINSNPKVNYEDFFLSFWNDNSREGKLHRVISRKRDLNKTSIYTVEFYINKLKKYLDENNIK
jgi:hypothetical protein